MVEHQSCDRAGDEAVWHCGWRPRSRNHRPRSRNRRPTCSQRGSIWTSIPAAKYYAHPNAVNRTMTASCAAAARAGDERGLDSARPLHAGNGGTPFPFSVERGRAPPAATTGIGIARDPEQPRHHHHAARNGDRLRTPHATTPAPLPLSPTRISLGCSQRTATHRCSRTRSVTTISPVDSSRRGTILSAQSGTTGPRLNWSRRCGYRSRGGEQSERERPVDDKAELRGVGCF
jgi:hypothetical protein